MDPTTTGPAAGARFAPPARPARMSQRRYRELYDADPWVVYVRAGGTLPRRYVVAGQVSGCVIANSYDREGVQVALQPAGDPPPEWWPPNAVGSTG